MTPVWRKSRTKYRTLCRSRSTRQRWSGSPGAAAVRNPRRSEVRRSVTCDGEPDSGTPAAVIDAAKTAPDGGRTRYAPLSGSVELQKAVADQTANRYGRDTRTEEIVLTHGGSGGLAATILALINPGDRVLIPEPTYSVYADHVAMVGAELIWVPNRSEGSLNLDVLRQAATTRMIILCNPGNPTGPVYPATDLQYLEQLLVDNPDLLLLADGA